MAKIIGFGMTGEFDIIMTIQHETAYAVGPEMRGFLSYVDFFK
jgi:hypothetical protein